MRSLALIVSGQTLGEVIQIGLRTSLRNTDWPCEPFTSTPDKYLTNLGTRLSLSRLVPGFRGSISNRVSLVHEFDAAIDRATLRSIIWHQQPRRTVSTRGDPTRIDVTRVNHILQDRDGSSR